MIKGSAIYRHRNWHANKNSVESWRIEGKSCLRAKGTILYFWVLYPSIWDGRTAAKTRVFMANDYKSWTTGDNLDGCGWKGNVNVKHCSVIIPTLNAGDCIKKLLKSLQSQTILPDEIIVVDSQSEDDTVVAAASVPGVRVISIERASFDHGGQRTLARWR